MPASSSNSTALSKFARFTSRYPSLKKPPTEREEAALTSMFERAGSQADSLIVRFTDRQRVSSTADLTPQQEYAMNLAAALSSIYRGQSHLPPYVHQNTEQAYKVACLFASELEKPIANPPDWPDRLGRSLAKTLTDVYLEDSGPTDQTDCYTNLVQDSLKGAELLSKGGLSDDEVLTAVYQAQLKKPVPMLNPDATLDNLSGDCYHYAPASFQ